MKFNFAVLGDIHYANKKYHQKALGGQGYLSEEQDIERYVWMSNNILPPMLSEIKKYNPDFIVQTGDFAHGHCDNNNLDIMEMEEALDILTGIGKPVLSAKGNHDDNTSYKKIILPYLSKVLKQNLTENYYAFEHDNAYFVFIDDLNFAGRNLQYEWLREELKNSKKKNHIFLFGHSPLFAVARAFFTEKEFVRAIIPLLQNNPIDGYFCGHTHNQCMTSHVLHNNRIFQAKSSIIGYPEKGCVPLDNVRTLISDNYEYYWGYLEDSCPIWLHVEINGKMGKVTWHLFPSGRIGEFRWQERGKIEIIEKPEMKPRYTINKSYMGKIESGRLHLAMYHSKDMTKSVRLNGKKIGCVPQGDSFAPRITIEIPKDMLSAIQMENIVEIDNPNKELFLIGGISLEIILTNGIKAITNVAPYLYTTSHEWDDWNVKELRFFEPGKTISPIRLHFR